MSIFNVVPVYDRRNSTTEPPCPRESAAPARPLTYLSVGHADEPLVDQLVCLGIPGLPFHDVALRRLVSQRDSWNLGGQRELTLCTFFVR